MAMNNVRSSVFLRNKLSFPNRNKILDSIRCKQYIIKRTKASAVPLTETWNVENEVKISTIEEGAPPEKVRTEDPAFNKLDLSFENAQEAYKSKTNFELFRALLIFNMCSVPVFVDKNKELMKFGRKVLGQKLFTKVMKGTFYGQFVAGEDIKRIQPVVERNLGFGVKSILDYSVEKDLSKGEAEEAEMKACVSEAQPEDLNPATSPHRKFRAHPRFADRREHVTGARTYFYKDEDQCDENMENFLDCIDGVSGTTNATGIAAIKLTALGRPQLLLQLSEVLSRVKTHFDMLANVTGNPSGSIDQVEFERYLKRINLDREERKRWYTVLDSSKDGQIDMLDWFNLLEVNISLANLLRVPNTKTGTFEPLVTALTKDEEEQMKNMLRRIDTVAQYGRDSDVRVMIDAEQTYFQPAITRLTMEMMRKYNTEKAIVFNTYQCYLRDALNSICTDLALSKRENFYFGAKLVRGAYMDQERLRASTLGYFDPINPSFEATTAMYEKVLTEVMRQIQERERGQITVMIASHNEDTVRFAVNKMKEYGIKSNDKLICFGQLLGMCDQVSFSLGQAGYSVYKYVPYGPVEEVLPYLSRRAVENKGLLAKVKKEKRLIRQELFRRLRTLKWFYRPPEGQVAVATAAGGR